MSTAKSFLESQARRWLGNVDGARRSLSEASFPNLVSLSDFPKLKLNPNPRRRGRSLSEASNRRNLLSLESDLLSEDDLSDYPNPNPISLESDLLSEDDLSDYPDPNPISLSDLLSEDSLSVYPDPNLISLSDLLSEGLFDNPNLIFPKPSPNPRRPTPYYRGWGKLSRGDWGKLCPKEKEDWFKLIKRKAEQKEENKYHEQKEEMKDHKKAQQLSFSFSHVSATPNTTKEELSAVVQSSSEITTTKEEFLAPPSPTSEEELLAPPTSEEDPWQSMLGCSEAEWIAELQSKGNKCEICGGTNHFTLACSYWVEIPPDAEIVDERSFVIACAHCSMRLVDGACVNECLPPLQRKVIQKTVDFGCRSGGLPKKELFAPPSSEMVVHSSSEETTTPCIRGLSTSSSLKLNGELHARATTPPFAFPDVPACIHGLSSSSSLKCNGELNARAPTKTFAFPDLPALHSRATNPPL